jgi:RNA polymerase sigma-70 factor (ECF subfamily)
MEDVVTYCVIPRELAPLADRVRGHFAADPRVEVVLERRSLDERPWMTRAGQDGGAVPEHSKNGRRRHVPCQLTTSEMPALPAELEEYADSLVFIRMRRSVGAGIDELTSRNLVRRAQAGDGRAFEKLYLRYHGRIYAWLRVSLRDRHAAEDAVQHVFSQALEALPRFEVREDPVLAWLFRIARNHVINLARQGTRFDLVAPTTLTEHHEAGLWGSSSAATPSAGGDDSELGEELRAYVEELSLTQRQVVTLRFMFDLATEEIATVMDLTPDNVRQVQHRALRALRGRLGNEYGPMVMRRERMLILLKHAPVLQSRRFALAYSGASRRVARAW